jgi:FkbM family methyltransferase
MASQRSPTLVRPGRVWPGLAALLALTGVVALGAPGTADEAPAEPSSSYSSGPASRGGTGRFYMGREIAQVMGHRGADWLDRPSREREERTDLLIERLPLEPDDVVVDLGAGTGFFSLPLARRVSEGRVLAVDLQPEMLARIRSAAARHGLDHIELIRATETDPRIPAATADVVLIVDAYHEFSHPREVMRAVVAGLRPGGRVFLVEYRAEDPSVPIKRLHKMSEAQAIRELEAVGLDWRETLDFLPRQHVLVFERPR